MAKYIEREALYKEVTQKYHDINTGSYPFNIVAYDMAQLIKAAPAADVVEVKHGEWIIKDDDYDCELMCCSICKSEFYDGDNDTVDHLHNYCPNCGAKMDLKEGADNA